MSVERRTALLVDRHPMWLDAIARVLTANAADVVGKTTSLTEASKLIDDVRPDLVVVEIETNENGTTGLAWLLETVQSHTDLKLIALSSSEDESDIQNALMSGAMAYVTKKAQPDDLALALRQVYEHSIYLPRIVDLQRPTPPSAELDGTLTPRELETLQLLAEGMSNAQLAERIRVTEQTVKFHLSNIYKKLHVSNRTEASRWAHVHGLLAPQFSRSTSAA